MRKESIFYIITAVIIGLGGALLAIFGNPLNTGICISCFMENYAGALKLHNNIYMQYLRPEITYILLGSFVFSFLRREFKPRYSPSFLISFLGGVFMIIGSAVFLGCPIKMILRLAGGDLTSIPGIVGLIGGVYSAVVILKTGIDTTSFTQKAAPNTTSAYILPFFVFLLALVQIFKNEIFAESTSGPAQERAPFVMAVTFSLLIGCLSQYSRFCVTGSLRNSLITKKWTGIFALFLLFLTTFIVNAVSHKIIIGIYGQPSSHTSYLWSFLSLFLTGYIAVIIDGCPFRQLIKSGEGDINAQIAFVGMLLGAAFVQNFGILSDASGPTPMGKFGLILGFLIFSVITLELRRKND